MAITETEPSTPVEGIAARTVKGTAWLYGRQILANTVNLVVMAILASKHVTAV